MDEMWVLILGLGGASFAIRLGGYLLAKRLPQSGAWARGMEALPGCLIMALVALMIFKAGPLEWGVSAIVLIIAIVTRMLPLSMISGMAIIAVLRAL